MQRKLQRQNRSEMYPEIGLYPDMGIQPVLGTRDPNAKSLSEKDSTRS